MEIPSDEMFETVAKVGALKHRFLAECDSPLKYRADDKLLAEALLAKYKFTSFDSFDLALISELAETWFEYRIDDNGEVTWTNRVDWGDYIQRKSDAS